jgi:phenylalanyl-tRNA synthetase beta chain
LNSLGLKIKLSLKDKLKLEIPHFRYDLQDEIDITEEVARICGYGKIPNTLPPIVEQPTRKPTEMVLEDRIREVLAGVGFNEIITYSLFGKRTLAISGISEKDCVEIKNPLSAEQEVMRPSLLSGMLNAMIWNINRKAKDLKLFELGKIYIKDAKDKFSERRFLSIGITGEIYSGWDGKSRTSWFSDLVGAFENILSEFGINSLSYKLKEARDERFASEACASIEIDDKPIGISGEISQKILNNFDIKNKVCFLEIGIEPLIKYGLLEKRFKELPKYPSVSRDISIVVGGDVLNADLESSIKDAGGPILKSVSLIDRYTGEQIPDGKVGLTYRLEYQDLKKTLEEKDVSDIHSKILQVLEKNIGARLR